MLKTLRIQNFKGWKDTDTIRMAPVTQKKNACLGIEGCCSVLWFS